MREDLRAAWQEGLGRTHAFETGGDPEPVLETLGLVLVLELTGDLATLGGQERAVLRDRGRRALLAGAPPDVDPDDWQLARDLARTGLALIEGRSGPMARETGAAGAAARGLHPPDGQLLDMLRGKPDGLSAAMAARHVRGCDRCGSALRVVEQAAGSALAPLAVAAAGAAPIRSPAEGVLVSRIEDPEAEVLLFQEDGSRLLAVYATEAAPVRVAGEGLTTEQMLAGYWIGRVDDSVGRLHAKIHVGDRAVDLEVDLPAR